MAGSDAQQESDLSATHVKMGRIGAPWGLKGWVKLISFTDPLDNLLDYQHFIVTGCGYSAGHSAGQGRSSNQPENPSGKPLKIVEARPQGKGIVARLEGCDDRDQCSSFTGGDLWIPKALLPELEGEYYWYQLENLKVVNLQGTQLGIVHHLLATGANDVLVVRAGGVERLLPYVPQVVRKVDLGAGLIEVDWLPEWD